MHDADSAGGDRPGLPEEPAPAATFAGVPISLFLTDFLHELRTPLGALTGYAELLADEALTPEQQRVVAGLLRATHQLLELTQELHALIRLETRQPAFDLVPVALAEVVGEALALVAPLAQARAVPLPPAVLSSAAWVVADPGQLRTVLVGVLAQALLATSSPEPLEIGWQPTAPAGWRILVGGRGFRLTGVAGDRWFSLLTRKIRIPDSETATATPLRIQQLVRAFGGTIGLTTLPDGSSQFWIELPQADPPAG